MIWWSDHFDRIDLVKVEVIHTLLGRVFFLSLCVRSIFGEDLVTLDIERYMFWCIAEPTYCYGNEDQRQPTNRRVHVSADFIKYRAPRIFGNLSWICNPGNLWHNHPFDLVWFHARTICIFIRTASDFIILEVEPKSEWYVQRDFLIPMCPCNILMHITESKELLNQSLRMFIFFCDSSHMWCGYEKS